MLPLQNRLQSIFQTAGKGCILLKILVGERGFEPPTPWSRTRCSTRLSHSPTRKLRQTRRTTRRNSTDYSRATGSGRATVALLKSLESGFYLCSWSRSEKLWRPGDLLATTMSMAYRVGEGEVGLRRGSENLGLSGVAGVKNGAYSRIASRRTAR